MTDQVKVSSLRLTICILGNFAFLLSSAVFLNQLVRKNSLRNTIRVTDSLDADQARPIIGLGLLRNCFQKLSADDTSS